MSTRPRGRLLVSRPPPGSWRAACPPMPPVRLCPACGARLVARSAAFVRCERGCTFLPPRPARKPLPPPPLPASFRQLRELERDLVRQARRGRPPGARVIDLALAALESLSRAFPDRAGEIVRALRARRAAAA